MWSLSLQPASVLFKSADSKVSDSSCWTSYSETVISYLLMITPYKSNTFTYYFVSKVISYVTRYVTILLFQPNQLPKKVTHNLLSSQNLQPRFVGY